MDDIRSQTKKLVRLFRPHIPEEIIPWTSKDSVGLSILRDYPDKLRFIPAKNKNGLSDSVALIKIGYVELNEDKAELFVSVSKASRFLLKGNWDFNENNPDSPTKLSLEISKNSRQPIDLEENSRYLLNFSLNQIWDKEKNKFIQPSQVVDDIFKEHLRTLSYAATIFRSKMKIQKETVNIIPLLTERLIFVNNFFFGRTIRKTDDLSSGIFKPYSWNDLQILKDEKTNIFGSNISITNRTARTLVVITLSIFLSDYYFKYDFLGFVKLSNASDGNIIFSTSLIGGLLIIFDILIPRFIFYLVNASIRLKLWLMFKRIKF